MSDHYPPDSLPMEPMQRRPAPNIDEADSLPPQTHTRERMLEAALAIVVEQNNDFRRASHIIALNESQRVFGSCEIAHGLSLGWLWTEECGALCGRRES